jgi:hypothetical protein
MVYDLAPYMRPALENILEDYYKKQAHGDKHKHMEHNGKIQVFIKLAQGMLGGYESLFFVNGDKIAIKEMQKDASRICTIIETIDLERGGKS